MKRFVLHKATGEIGSLVDHRCVLYNEAAGRRLPLRYQEVEYLQSNGSQWIDTEVQQTSTMCVDMKLSQVNASYNYLYGARQSNQAMIYNGLYNNNILEFNWLAINYTASNDVTMTQEIVDNQMHITINDQEFTRALGTSDSNNIFLFGCNNSSVRTYTSLKVYYFILHDGDFRRTFIPCYDKENNNKPGLYELTEGKFYINKGSGTDFSYGADVSPAVPTRFVLYYQPKFYLYDMGNEFTSFTGGWTEKYIWDTHPYYSGGASGTLTKEDDGMTISSGIQCASTATRCANQIDVTRFKKLCVTVTSYSAATYPNASIVVHVHVSNPETEENAAVIPITGTGTFEVDLSEISGYYYIIFQATNAMAAGTDAGTTAKISSLWLE